MAKRKVVDRQTMLRLWRISLLALTDLTGKRVFAEWGKAVPAPPVRTIAASASIVSAAMTPPSDPKQ